MSRGTRKMQHRFMLNSGSAPSSRSLSMIRKPVEDGGMLRSICSRHCGSPNPGCSLKGRLSLRYFRPENINGCAPVTRDAARRLVKRLDGRTFLALVLIFSQTTYGMPQNPGGQAISALTAASSSSQADPQAPAAAPPQLPAVLLEEH